MTALENHQSEKVGSSRHIITTVVGHSFLPQGSEALRRFYRAGRVFETHRTLPFTAGMPSSPVGWVESSRPTGHSRSPRVCPGGSRRLDPPYILRFSVGLHLQTTNYFQLEVKASSPEGCSESSRHTEHSRSPRVFLLLPPRPYPPYILRLSFHFPF